MKNKILNKFPTFYIQLLHAWTELRQDPITAETVLAQYLWNNVFIKVNNIPIEKLFNFELFVGDLFQGKEFIQWESFKAKYNLTNVSYFKFRQILAAIPRRWKKIVQVPILK